MNVLPVFDVGFFEKDHRVQQGQQEQYNLAYYLGQDVFFCVLIKYSC